MIEWALESQSEIALPPEQWLSAAERGRYRAFLHPRRRRDWLLGRWTAKRMAQRLLADEWGRELALDRVEIWNDGSGVPHISGDPFLDCLELSISHSHGCGFAAASHEPLGADLEWIESRVTNFVDDYFTETEIATVNEASPELHEMVTTAIWSAKEAALKALHKGLSVDTRAVSCELGCVYAPPRRWQRFSIMPDSRYLGDCALPDASLVGWWRTVNGFVMTIVKF